MKYYILAFALLFCIGGCDGGGGGANVPPDLLCRPHPTIASGSILTIGFDSWDQDSTTSIVFYADTDSVGFDGVQIGTAIDSITSGAVFPWDVSGVADGLYFIYGTISDGVNPIVTSEYRVKPVIVFHSGSEPPAYAVLKFAPSGSSGLINILYDVWFSNTTSWLDLVLIVEYRGGLAGATWIPATTQGTTTPLSEGSKSIYWDSATDEPGMNASDYQIRISIQNTGTGVLGPPDVSSSFTVIN